LINSSGGISLSNAFECINEKVMIIIFGDILQKYQNQKKKLKLK